MTDTVLATYNNVKFIHGITKMTQDNWQAYFAPNIRNGVYSGLGTYQYYSPDARLFHVMDGIAYANGIQAVLEASGGYVDVGGILATGDKDAFLCLRIYFGSETAELVKKSNIVDEITEYTSDDFYKCTWALNKFVGMEDYQCERNDEYWELPLFYIQSTSGLVTYGLDLRRIIKPGNPRELNPRNTSLYNNYSNLVRSNDIYTITADKSFYIDSVNTPDGALIVNTGGTSTTVKLYTAHYFNNQNIDMSTYPSKCRTAYDNSYGVKNFVFHFRAGLTTSSGIDSGGYQNRYYTVTLAANQALRITFVEASLAGGIYEYHYLVE